MPHQGTIHDHPTGEGSDVKKIRLGGGSGYWGEALYATGQLLESGPLDYIVYDYLAEITMSIMARARTKDPSKGYAADFVTDVIAKHAKDIKDKGVKILSNAGGVNPKTCADHVVDVLSASGIDLKVAYVLGDDLINQADSLAKKDLKEMFSGADFPDPDTIASINCYLGARAVVAALEAGADIVITGRSVDSALALAACVHDFGWAWDDWDKLSSGSLVGHILECGPQATGGNYTDWQDVGDGFAQIGYPLAEISEDGRFIIEKPPGSGGVVTRGTVAEQMLYEIGDPQAYLLPDVTCDFTDVILTEIAPDRVRVEGARGRPAPAQYKASVTYADGFKQGVLLSFFGADAVPAARAFAKGVLARARASMQQAGMVDFSETSIELLGAEEQFGPLARAVNPRDIVLKLACRHKDVRALSLFGREVLGMALGAPPGLTVFQVGRPKPSPVVRLFSVMVPKDDIAVQMVLDDIITDIGIPHSAETADLSDKSSPAPPVPPLPEDATLEGTVPLSALAYGRSGDKGNHANIGIIARHSKYVPYIADALTADRVGHIFAHFQPGEVSRYYLPGSHALNFLIRDVLGGGGIASLRNDTQAKSYAQILLTMDVKVPAWLAAKLTSQSPSTW